MHQEVNLIPIPSYNDKASGIYIIRNTVNGKIYIGSSTHIQSRFSAHRSRLKKQEHDNSYLQNTFNKYGIDVLEFGIIEIVNDRNKILEREQFWIDHYRSFDPKIGYNRCPDAIGKKGLVFTPRQRKNISLGKINKPCPWKRKLTDDQALLIITEFIETPKTVREIASTFGIAKNSVLHILNRRTFKHLVLSDDTLNALTLALNGNRKKQKRKVSPYVRSQEARINISLAKKGVPNKKKRLLTDEQAVMIVEHYLSTTKTILEMSEFFNASRGVISDILSGKTFDHANLTEQTRDSLRVALNGGRKTKRRSRVTR